MHCPCPVGLLLSNTVNHKILINRLRGLVGMSSPVSRCFSSYLVGRSFSVAGNHRISNPTDQACGVSQGSVLRPLLFLLHILPLGEIIQHFNNVSYHLFGDYLQLCCSFKASEAHTLISSLSCLSNEQLWLSDNSLQLSSEKTEPLIVAPESATNGLKQRLGNPRSSVKSGIQISWCVF